jgi:hypothetical protein
MPFQCWLPAPRWFRAGLTTGGTLARARLASTLAWLLAVPACRAGFHVRLATGGTRCGCAGFLARLAAGCACVPGWFPRPPDDWRYRRLVLIFCF